MKKKVLIIEDDRSFARLAGYILERNGYEVLTATNGFEGICRAMVELPDLVILDVLLPDIDGPDLCRVLHSKCFTYAIPIITVSAKLRMPYSASALDYDGNCYLEKPVEPEILLEKVLLLLSDNEELERACAMVGPC